MSNAWKKDEITLAMKLKLFNAIIISVLVYGYGSWKGIKKVEDRMCRFKSNCLRRIMKIQ